MRPATGGCATLALLLALAACGSPGRPLPHPSPTPSQPPVYRALWVDAFRPGIHSPSEIDDLVSTAHRANLNALFVQVRKAGDAYYLHSLEPVATDITGPRGFDPLAYLLRRAHAQRPRIEVHAWVNTFFVGTQSLVYRFRSADWGNRTSTGDTGGFLDPGDPGVRGYTKAVLLNLIARYAVDGLHLDYVRYPGADWGYGPAAVAAFDAAQGRTGAPGPDDPTWQQWRRDQVTTFVRDLSGALARLRPAVRLSVAAIAWGGGPADGAGWEATAAYREVYQDWDAWLRLGILDFAVPMNYDPVWWSAAARWFEQWVEWEKDHQYGRRVLIGVAAYLNYPEDTLNQVRRALLPSAAGYQAAGVAIYSYGSTSPYGTSDYTDDPSAAATLPRQPYAEDLDASGLHERALRFNAGFWHLLTDRTAYTDPVLGPIRTEPVFHRPAPVPALPPRPPATR